ncbi:MAG TPA: kynureninase [Cytophagales bacterium]|nr:kynureninase [Cytophagales bacterium]
MIFENSSAFALKLDQEDELKDFRNRFFIPTKDGKAVIYFNGNSLGLQPKTAEKYINQELKDWAELAGQGHFKAKNPWVSYHKLLQKPLADLTGASENEVTAMNSLTTNLHLLMVSFYRPDKKKYKIIMENGAFSSDQYAVETQVKFHGFDPQEAIIELAPNKDKNLLATEEIIEAIESNKEEVALILLGGVNFYTGQAFDLEKISAAGHKAGAIVGFDLAHAIGNIKLELHKWDIDFAVWCSYKYLNSGPGGVGGAFVHEKFAKDNSMPRFGGWWGYLEEERFKMEKGFKPMEGVAGWQLSNVPIISLAVQRASLDIFEEAGMDNILQKGKQLTGYLEFLLKQTQDVSPCFDIITPSDPSQRGCQLSLYFKKNAEEIYQRLIEHGVSVDMRRPNVIRVTPVPLYNTFQEVFHFSKRFDSIIKSLSF